MYERLGVRTFIEWLTWHEVNGRKVRRVFGLAWTRMGVGCVAFVVV